MFENDFTIIEEDNIICMGITSDLMFAAMNVIIGVEKHSPGLIQRYVIFYLEEDPISEIDKKSAERISDKVEFRVFNPKIKQEDFKEIIDKYTLLYFCKFAVFDLIKEFNNVLWLDVDLLIQGDISPIFNSKTIAWRASLSARFCDLLEFPGIIISENDTKPNAGVIFVNRNEKNSKITMDECWELAKEIRKCTKRLSLDEMVFGIIVIKHKINVTLLPREYNLVFHMKSSRESVIQHAMGKKKFWNNSVMNLIFGEWRQNNQKWIDVGGTSYVGPIEGEIGKSSASIYKAFCWLDYWSKILPSEYEMKDRNLIPGNYFSNFVQFYIKNVNHKVHYELMQKDKDYIHTDVQYKDENIVMVCLHIEDKKYITEEILEKMRLLSIKEDYCITKNDNKILLEKDVLESGCIKELYDLVDNTYTFIFGKLCRKK